MLRWNALLDAIIVQCRNEYGNKSCSGKLFWCTRVCPDDFTQAQVTGHYLIVSERGMLGPCNQIPSVANSNYKDL